MASILCKIDTGIKILSSSIFVSVSWMKKNDIFAPTTWPKYQAKDKYIKIKLIKYPKLSAVEGANQGSDSGSPIALYVGWKAKPSEPPNGK